MTSQQPISSQPTAWGRAARRAAAAVLLGGIAFAVLWITVFSAMTSTIVAVGFVGVLVVGSACSSAFEWIFELLASIVFGVLAVLGAMLSFLLAPFGN